MTPRSATAAASVHLGPTPAMALTSRLPAIPSSILSDVLTKNPDLYVMITPTEGYILIAKNISDIHKFVRTIGETSVPYFYIQKNVPFIQFHSEPSILTHLLHQFPKTMVRTFADKPGKLYLCFADREVRRQAIFYLKEYKFDSLFRESSIDKFLEILNFEAVLGPITSCVEIKRSQGAAASIPASAAAMAVTETLSSLVFSPPYTFDVCEIPPEEAKRLYPVFSKEIDEKIITVITERGGFFEKNLTTIQMFSENVKSILTEFKHWTLLDKKFSLKNLFGNANPEIKVGYCYPNGAQVSMLYIDLEGQLKEIAEQYMDEQENQYRALLKTQPRSKISFRRESVGEEKLPYPLSNLQTLLLQEDNIPNLIQGVQQIIFNYLSSEGFYYEGHDKSRSPSLYKHYLQFYHADLMHCIDHGNKEEVKRILTENPNLLWRKIEVSDKGKIFFGTPYQYALYKMDFMMIRLLFDLIFATQGIVNAKQFIRYFYDNINLPQPKSLDLESLRAVLQKIKDAQNTSANHLSLEEKEIKNFCHYFDGMPISSKLDNRAVPLFQEVIEDFYHYVRQHRYLYPEPTSDLAIDFEVKARQFLAIVRFLYNNLPKVDTHSFEVRTGINLPLWITPTLAEREILFETLKLSKHFFKNYFNEKIDRATHFHKSAILVENSEEKMGDYINQCIASGFQRRK